MKRLALAGCLVSAALSGCASSAKDVREATSIMSLGGVPGAGVVALTATAIDLGNQVKYINSPSIQAQYVKFAKEKRLKQFVKWYQDCKIRFGAGEWTEDASTRAALKLEYEKGKKVSVPFMAAGNKDFSLVFVYRKGFDDIRVMTPLEWQGEAKEKINE